MRGALVIGLYAIRRKYALSEFGPRRQIYLRAFYFTYRVRTKKALDAPVRRDRRLPVAVL